MITPLYPHLAPLTFSWGFLKSKLPQAQKSLHSWLKGLSLHWTTTELYEALDNVLWQMQPLTLPPSKRLLVATESDWTACFDNGANGADLLSLITVLTSRLSCCGIIIRCVSDKRMYSSHDQHDHFTHLALEIFKPGAEPLISPTRSVSLFQYYGKWKFTQNGEPLPGEDVNQYKVNPIQRRLTLESIAMICSSIGLSPFAQSFYLPHACLATLKGLSNYPVSRSLVESQAIFSPISDQK